LTVVLFLLGLLLVIQFRAQSGPEGLQQLSSQDLTTLIANLNVGNEQLREEVRTLEARVAELTDASSRGETSVDELRRDLRRLTLWSGQDPVSGRGVIVRLDGPVTADAVNDVLNELRGAGAEALAVEGVRVVPGTVVAGEPGALTVEALPLAASFRVEAIGEPTNLTASLVRQGGMIARIQAAQPGVAVDVEPVDALALPATQRPLVPADARPRT
jgi:uncharacterized protein YlxW (UPF0749 family)